MFRTVAGDATSVLLVDVLARDVLLTHSAAAAPGSRDGAGLDANELQHMYFCLFVYLIFVNSKPLFFMSESFVGQPPSSLRLSPPAIETASGCLDAMALLRGNESSRCFALASRNPPLVATLVAGERKARSEAVRIIESSILLI